MTTITRRPKPARQKPARFFLANQFFFWHQNIAQPPGAPVPRLTRASFPLQTINTQPVFQMSTVEETVEEGEEGADNADDDGEHAGDVPEAEQPGTSRGRSPARKPAAAKSTAAAAGAAAAAVTAAGGVGAVSASSNSSSGGAGGGAGSGGGRFGFARGRRKTAGDAAVDARPASPKRAVAVVRRQSVSKVGGPVMPRPVLLLVLLFLASALNVARDIHAGGLRRGWG